MFIGYWLLVFCFIDAYLVLGSLVLGSFFGFLLLRFLVLLLVSWIFGSYDFENFMIHFTFLSVLSPSRMNQSLLYSLFTHWSTMLS